MKKVLMAAAFSASVMGCSNTSCVARRTKVLTPDGWRPIEDLEIGDLVYAINEDTGERLETPVTAIKTAMREVGAIQVGGTELRMTTDHPVYCPRDQVYAPAGDWLLGKRTQLAMLGDDGLKAVVATWTRTFIEVTEVFDITVEHELHNFIANGVLVHNKSPEDQTQRCECPDGAVYYDYACNDEPCADLGTDVSTSNNNLADMSSKDTGVTSDMSTMADAGSDAGGAVDMGAPRHRGSCTVDADCARDTWSCITIPANDPDGYHTCQPAEAAEPGCATIEAPDTCCLHSDCNQADPSGTCIVGPIFYCGGVQPIIANVCVTDECATDTDCGADELCLPPRVLGEPVSRCVAAGCKVDADCDSRAGGECTEFFDPCNRRLVGFACTYDDSVCRADGDCPPDNMNPGTPYCAMGAGDGDTACMSFAPPP